MEDYTRTGDKDLNSIKLPYRYGDKPDGEDCFVKVMHCGRIGFLLGLGAALIDYTITPSHLEPRWYAPRIFRGIQCGAPAFAVSVSLASIVSLATNIRKKDDQWNYVIGGGTAGVFTGLLYKHRLSMLLYGSVGAFFSYLYKEAKMNNYDFYDFDADKIDFFNKTLYVKKSKPINESE